MKKTIDWAILVFGLLGLVLIVANGFFGIEAIGVVPLDVNYLAVAIVVMYTFLTGLKLYFGQNRQMGFYMMLFSGLMIVLAVVSIRLQAGG